MITIAITIIMITIININITSYYHHQQQQQQHHRRLHQQQQLRRHVSGSNSSSTITVTTSSSSQSISFLLYPPLQRSWKGGILVSPCPSVRPSVCPSVDRNVISLYLQQYSSDPFYICTSYQATSEGVSPVMLILTLKKTKFSRIL